LRRSREESQSSKNEKIHELVRYQRNLTSFSHIYKEKARSDEREELQSNRSLQERLVRDYPFLSSADSFECSDGWYKLIDDLCQSIQSHLVISRNAHFQISLVKEMFGKLRIDFVFGDSQISKMIEEAMRKSGNVCTLCGSRGTLCYKDSGWVYFKTYCPNHAALYGYKEYGESPTPYADEK
jgi:hypothetical protein